ncbi:hypothetical protein JCM14720_18630 [Calditerricola yamamurae]|jgi:spore coat protein GerQ
MYPSYVPYPFCWPQGYPIAGRENPGPPGMEGRRPIPTPAPGVPPQLPLEESYIENILRLNLGKMATIYMTFENNTQWNAKVFRGRLEAAGKDHIIISDPRTGKRYLLLMVNVDWIEFEEPLRYFSPPRVP